MKIRVINVATATTRMAFQDAQLSRFGLIYERVDAITPDTLSPPSDDLSWAMWERPMRQIEKALYASHRSVWALIAAEDDPCLVFEDDALLSAQTPQFLTTIKTETGIDHINLEVRNRAKYVGKSPHPSLPPFRCHLRRLASPNRMCLRFPKNKKPAFDSVVFSAKSAWRCDPCATSASPNAA